MKKVISILLAAVVMTGLAGCDNGNEEAETAEPESGRWTELLRILPENEETLNGAFLQDIAYLEKKKQQHPDATGDYAINGNPPTLFGQSPNAYSDEEWRETLGFVRSDAEQIIYAGSIAPPRHYEAVRGGFDSDGIDNAVRTGPLNEHLETVSYGGYELYSWGEDFSIHMDWRSGVRTLGRGHRLALVDGFACWTLWTDGAKEMIDSYGGNMKSLADNEDFKLLAGVLEEHDTATAYFSTETQSYDRYTETFREIIEDPENNAARQAFVEEIERELRLKPYNAFATGAGLDEKGYYLVIALLNPDEATAKENAGLLEKRINESKLTWGADAGQPWAEIIEDMEIETEGRITTAKLYGQPCTLWDDFGIQSGTLTPLLIHE